MTKKEKHDLRNGNPIHFKGKNGKKYIVSAKCIKDGKSDSSEVKKNE